MVSERTRAALAARKRQGARLGNRTNLAEAQRRFAANAAPVIREIQAQLEQWEPDFGARGRVNR